MAGENINRRLNIYINDKEVVNSLGGITRELAKTKNELKHLNKGADDYDSEVKRLTGTLADLTKRQNDFKDELKLTNNEISAAKNNFSNLLTGLKSGDMKAVQSGLMGIKASIAETAAAGWAFIATPIGATIAALVGFGLATKAMFDFNEEIRESNKLLDNLGVDQKLRPEIEGLVQSYKVGFEELAKAVDDMTDLGLAKDSFAALDQIKEGLVKAPDKNEFLAMLKENGVAAKNLGLTLQGVIDLNESFEATGAKAESVFGALQKSSSTLILQSPELKKALQNAFGSTFTQKLLSDIKSGTITYYEALDKIYKKGNEVGISNRQQAQLAKDLFGKASISAGGYQMILKNVTEAQEKHTIALTETQKQVSALADANIELQKGMDRALKSDKFNAWKNNFDIAVINFKKNWYKFIEWLATTEKERAATKKDEQNQELQTQSISVYKSWLEKQLATKKESLGAAYDFQVVKEGMLAKLREQIGKADEKNDADKSKRLRLWYKTLQDFTEKTPNTKAAGELSDEEQTAADNEAKKRAKAIADAKKHSEDLLKIEGDLHKQLLETRRAADDLKLGLIADDYTRERELINAEYDRKIEDAKLNIQKEQDAIAILKAGIADPKTTKEDSTSFKKQLGERIEIQANYNATLVTLEQTKDLKIATLQEKYLELSFKKDQEHSAQELQNLKTKQNLELAAITTLEEAKALLSESLSTDELAKITTLEEAKKAIKKKYIEEQYKLELKKLEDLIALYQSALRSDFRSGFVLISDEEKAKLLLAIDEAKAKISEIKLNLTPDAEQKKAKDKVDILGFSAEDWNETFGHFDTMAESIQMAASVLTDAFGAYFKFLEAGEARTLAAFQKSADKKKTTLADQLNKGFITQEVYNLRIAKVDADLAKKKAEIEYRQAKRQKTMSIVQAVVSTAVAIMQAYAQLGPVGGTIAAVLIGALGALQIATIAAQPLPEKGYRDGGYTGDGPPDDVAGNVHKGEYVIPQKVLFDDDPKMPYIMGYIESKRKGTAPPEAPNEDNYTRRSQSSNNPSSGTNENQTSTLNRLSTILEKIEKDGLQSYLVNDIRAARKMDDKIKEYKKLKESAKP